MEYESFYDAKVIKVGNSEAITIPYETIEKLGLKEDDIIEVAIKRYKR